jgi:hypothetical protein
VVWGPWFAWQHELILSFAAMELLTVWPGGVQHVKIRFEAYVAAAGGILLFVCGGPLSSYTYVLQYLLVGKMRRVLSVALEG